jgi:biopolymer transport protein ExbD
MAAGISLDDDETISAINITPLVDVVLVLLIIFMITAPALYQSALKVQLPKAKTAEESKKSPLNFTITKSGELLLENEKLEWTELGNRLGKLGSDISEQTAIISADEGTLHGNVIRLMDSLRQAGLTHFGLNVDREPVQR